MRDSTLSSMSNTSSATGGRDAGSLIKDGPKSALLNAREARTNSYIRRVGVPSMQECSPRKPERLLSQTFTGFQIFQNEGLDRVGELTLVLVIPPIPTITNPCAPTDIFTSNGFSIIQSNNNHSPFDRNSAFFPDGEAAIKISSNRPRYLRPRDLVLCHFSETVD